MRLDWVIRAIGRRRHSLGLVGSLGLFLAVASAASGQSTTTGVLEGDVQDMAGDPLNGANVRVTELATGISWSLVASERGEFRLPLLPPGNYDIFVEQLGFKPKRIERVAVEPLRTESLSIRLEPAGLPVDEVDVIRSTPSFADRFDPAGSRPFARAEVRDLPGDRREIRELGKLTTFSNARLETEGLPGWLTGTVLDGLPFVTARHSDLSEEPHATEAIPLSSVGYAELVTNGVDVEFTGFPGGYLVGHTRRGTAQLAGETFGDWTGDIVSSSRFFDVQTTSLNSVRGGGVVSGPVVRDTAHFAAGVEVQSLDIPRPRALELRGPNSSLIDVARDSFGVNLSDWVRPRVVPSEVRSAFGRFDWQVTGSHRLGLRANLGSVEVGDGPAGSLDLGPGHTASLGSKLEATDFSAAASISSVLSRHFAQEFRLGLERSVREYDGTGLRNTLIVDDGLAFGTDPTPHGAFERLAVQGSQALHVSLGRHHLKVGASGIVTFIDQDYVYAREGQFLFSDIDGFIQGRGLFSQSIGPPPIAEFTTRELGVFLQDRWAAAPGLDLVLGLRYDVEHLPRDEVELNAGFRQRTGLSNRRFDSLLGKLSPRFGLTWDVGQRQEWFVRAGAGVYHGRTDPGLLSELVTHDASVGFRTGMADLSEWPAVPDSAAVPSVGRRLSLIGPEFAAPRTGRVTFGITRALDRESALHVSGVYRHTDFLPRRHDLNLRVTPSRHDQYGRPIYGDLRKEGSLVTVTPGSNRRFSEFDLVSALDSDGFSDYWGLTVALERRVSEQLDLMASYTYSRTTDNWLSARGGGPAGQLNPFPDSLNGDDWADGRSDFDVPHRVTLASQYQMPELLWGLRVAAFYRYQSGYPFTPGFRNGVDVNADGSGRNDPAFVDPDIEGTRALFGEWACLRQQAGGFAERNTCRGPAIHRLDVRLGVGVARFRGSRVELVLDGLNLLESELGVRDGALYLVDPEADLDATGETVAIPLRTNPDFGEPLVRQTSGRALRIGLNVQF